VKSIIVAAIVAALVSATAATAASGLITGAQIKNGSIGLADLSKSAKRALKGQRGPAGPPGATGAQGIAGPRGGFDPAKVSYIEGASFQVAPGAAESGSASCPAGAKALSGGWVVISGDVGEVFGNRSFDSGGSWSVVVFNHDSFTNATVTPFVVCAAA